MIFFDGRSNHGLNEEKSANVENQFTFFSLFLHKESVLLKAKQVFTLVNGKEVYKMEMVQQSTIMVIAILDNLKMDLKVVMENFKLILLGMSTKENLEMG